MRTVILSRRRSQPRHRTLLAAALVLWPGALAAQGRGELDLPRLPSPVHIDGVLRDSAWVAVPALPLTMYSPVFRGTPTERTEIRVAYDETYLYAAGWFYDSHPENIRINSLYRDRWSGDDAFALFIDPYNDNENGLWFLITPAGVRVDQSMSNDAETTSTSWNAVWDAATRVTDAGWFVEVRIPLASLGFQTRDGRVVMGLTVTRLIARSNERVTFPAIDPQYEFRKPSMMQDVVLRGVAPHRPVFVTPYVLSGVDRAPALKPSGTGWRAEQDMVNEAGLDLRYGVSDNLHLDLSLNTDFAQVEADDAQLNLTRFPLFFPEKRQFFQERAGVFDFDFGEGGRLFHSRRIGLAPDRSPIRILGGARAVARTGGWDVAALDMQTARSDTIPGENLGVTRIKRRILNPYSYAGGMMTARLANDGGYNVAAGLDASVRVFGVDQVTLRGASTFDDAARGEPLLDRSQVYAQWRRSVNSGLSYTASYNRAGAAYQPDLGFLPREDFTRYNLYAEYNHRPKQSALLSHGPGAIAYFYLGNERNTLETYYMAYWWIYAFRSGSHGWIEVIHHYEAEPEALNLGDGASVAAGTYKFAELWLNYQPPSGSLFRVGVDGRIGGFYDGWRARLKLDPTWNLSRNLELGGSYEINRIRFPDRAGLDAHVARLRVGIAANARLSAVTLGQYNSVDDRLGLNLRMRYNFREGSDLWLVYDEALNTDRDEFGADPILPRSAQRVFRIKVTHTLTP